MREKEEGLTKVENKGSKRESLEGINLLSKLHHPQTNKQNREPEEREREEKRLREN